MSRSPQRIVRGHTVPPRQPQGRREGFTTGTAAAAAAKAACLVLLDQGWPETVSIWLPIGRTLQIPINTLVYEADSASAGVVKDAGDDPDVTHGAEIFATVRRVPAAGVHIRGGTGVGVVTRRGLELPVGSPAINPVPQRMIRQAVGDILGSEQPDPGVEVTISVPNGEQLARRTFNARLGIIGGLSILGTTGIVRAMSTAAWRASVYQAIDVAAANGVGHLVLTTGGRSETFARRLFPHLPELAFVQMGIFTGASIQRAAQRGVPRVTLCAMIGKLSKTAAGHMQSHVAGHQVDCGFLAELAADLGAPPSLVTAIRHANTARHVQELIEAAGFSRFYNRLCELAAQRCVAAARQVAIEVVLVDFDGRVLGRAAVPAA
ncbi:MAG: cobalt-precorrin-5B (C(1))-methyltransferase [Gemmataceae bacterium]|nr:cobalt-precorrin-5B (C(1))-methyltransferase [Gemmataceae bacterium]MDW8266415.1 cobalt-precorrin-5B (C(1))-methyltransferase [Gemmataceae bacterium]